MTTQIESTKENFAIAIESMARHYFHLVTMVLGETVKQGNNWIVSSESDPPDWQEYDNKTSWSDFKLILPVYFALYHGLELAMKALLAINDNKIVGHELTKIYSELSKTEDVPSSITSLFSKYIERGGESGILAEFVKANNRSVDDFYDFLRYPTDKSYSVIYNYWTIKYKQEEALSNYKEIINDLAQISREVQQYIKDKLPNT